MKKPLSLVASGAGDSGLSRYLIMIPAILRILEVGQEIRRSIMPVEAFLFHGKVEHADRMELSRPSKLI